MKEWKSAAAARLLLHTGTTTIPAAIQVLGASVLDDTTPPPTDLAAIATKLNATLASVDIFGSGELRRSGNAYEIVYAKDLSIPRRRFTIAHELAHLLILRTGPQAPTAGKEVERLCDLIAAELLMPSQTFPTHTPQQPCLTDLFALAKQYQTSLAATAHRCTDFRSITVFEAMKGKITWCSGTLRSSKALNDRPLVHLIQRACNGESGTSAVFLSEAAAVMAVRAEYRSLGTTGRAIFLLSRTSPAEARAANEREHLAPPSQT